MSSTTALHLDDWVKVTLTYEQAAAVTTRLLGMATPGDFDFGDISTRDDLVTLSTETQAALGAS